MNWDALGAIGEIFGAIATLAMLVYLSIQVRHAQKTTQSASELEASRLITRLVERVAEDRELQRIWDDVAENKADIPREDISHYLWHISTFVHAAEGVWEQFQKGLISERIWAEWERGICGALQVPVTYEWWSKRGATYSTEFYQFIDDALSQNSDWKMSSTKQWTSVLKTSEAED